MRHAAQPAIQNTLMIVALLLPHSAKRLFDPNDAKRLLAQV